MNARITIATVGTLIIAGTLIECLDQDKHKTAGCLRACGWDEQKTLTKRARASSSLSCDQCLRRRRDLYRHAITAFLRRRRQSLSNDCASRADDNSPVPEIQLASNVAVKFGQYDNTDDWYAYVSWSPINDTAGFLKGYSVRYSFDSDILCANVPKNQTSVRINMSCYGYNQGEIIHPLVVSIPNNMTVTGMLSFCDDKTSTSPPPSQTMTSVRVTTKSSKAAKASIATETSKARTTTKGSDKPMKYVYISVGAVAGVLAVVLAGVFHKKFIRICVKRGGFNYDRPLSGLYF